MKKIILLVILSVFLIYPVFSEEKNPYPQKEFNELYRSVAKHYKKEELLSILMNSEVITPDDQTEKNLKFIFDPASVRKQAQRHGDYISKLVNDDTVKKGVEFFGKYYDTLEAVYKKTKVHPADIIAIINWESKLGEMTGTQNIIKIFVGQFFFHNKYMEIHKAEGSFGKEGAMTPELAEKRAARLKKNALGNLSALLIQAKKKKFDPVKVLGSWAGAIGFPQFMPASMQYAADGNNDGKIDLFTMEDAIASVANYLAKNGYHSKGREHSFKRYNPDRVYAKGVKMYGDLARKSGVEPGKCPPSEAACPIDL